MEQNIKKRNAHDIYFGIDQVTGKARHISEVVSGAKCGCICSACGKPLEARKGSVRKHHFSHISNYECMYASEVAIYKVVADILGDLRSLVLPSITLSFPAWDYSDCLKETRKVEIEAASFSCEPLQYPPVLFVTVSQKRLRILLEFENYYSQEDLTTFVNEARIGGYSSLLFHFPSIGDRAFFIPEQLKSVLTDGVREQKWIRSELTDLWRDRFLSKSIQPAKWGTGYECPIHVGKYKGKYSARWIDCAHCRFNLAEPPSCRCLAVSGIQCYTDFYEPPSVLQKRIDDTRRKNDQEIERREKQERREKERRAAFNAPKRQLIPPRETPPGPQPEAPLLYSPHMIQCSYCGQMKSTDEFAAYGGSGTVIENICKICARKMT